MFNTDLLPLTRPHDYKITKTKTQNNYNSFEPRVNVEKYTLKTKYEAGISIMWVNI